MNDMSVCEIFSTLGQRYRGARAAEIAVDEGEKSDRQKLIDASIEQQMLFEKWLKQDDWLLRSEAMPLIIGAEPDDWQTFLNRDDNRSLEESVWQQIRTGVTQQSSPRIENAQQDEDSWRVRPQDLHYWARTQTIAVPSAYDMLLSFVSSAVKKEPEPEQEQPMGVAQFMASNTAGDREMVLGAGLAMVATFPEKCRDQHGWVDGYTLAKLIEEKGALVFDERAPVLNTSEMAELLDSWIKKME